MCWRPGCLFKDTPSAKRLSGQDGYTKLLIIGATGMTGNALLEAAVACVWFQVTAFTRDAAKLKANKHVKDGRVKIAEGDMLDPPSLRRAMIDMHAVFFSTSYWNYMDPEFEYEQGVNVVQAASKSGINHLVYVGTQYIDENAIIPCKYLMGKERVQAYVMGSGVPYTIVQMGFYFENLMSVFKPHRVEPLTYAVALPMGSVGLNCGSMLDFGHCIAKVILCPNNHFGTTVKLATGYYTVTQLAALLDRQFRDLTFLDPKIPIHEYQSLKFPGSEELSAMFMHLQTFPHYARWDTQLAFKLCPSARSLKEWLVENEKGFSILLQEEEEKIVGPIETLQQQRDSASSEYKRRLNSKNAFRNKEDNFEFQRQAALCEEVMVTRGFMDFWRDFLDADG